MWARVDKKEHSNHETREDRVRAGCQHRLTLTVVCARWWAGSSFAQHGNSPHGGGGAESGFWGSNGDEGGWILLVRYYCVRYEPCMW